MMSDGARCHYCRKVPCVCAEPAEPMNEQLQALYHEFGHDVPGIVDGVFPLGSPNYGQRARAIIAKIGGTLLAAREELADLRNRGLCSLVSDLAERDSQIAALRAQIDDLLKSIVDEAEIDRKVTAGDLPVSMGSPLLRLGEALKRLAASEQERDSLRGEMRNMSTRYNLT